jgi:hypothetical protein
MITGTRVIAALTAAGVAAAIALTPTSSSNASNLHGGHKPADLAARHGHVIR